MHFPEMVDTHFQYRNLRVLRHGKHRQRHADFIIIISHGLMDPVFLREYGSNEFFGTGLPHASGDAYNVTVIVKHTDGHFNKVIAGARAYGSEHDNVNVEIQSPTSATSYDEQVNMIETALGNPGIDAVIIAPQQSTSTATLVDTATKPVVALDTDFTSDKKACFVGTGNEDAALNGGKAVAEACKALGKDKPTAVIIAGVQGDETHEARLRGYRDAIEAAGGQVLEVQYTDTMPDKAAAAMEAVIQKYPDGVDAVLSIADDMALAAAKVIKDSGNTNYADTVLCGFDGNQSAIEAVMDLSLIHI